MAQQNKNKHSDSIMTCAVCNMRVMMKGDWSGWKGVQAEPERPDTFRWFCGKKLCQSAYQEALQAAIVQWQATMEQSDG